MLDSPSRPGAGGASRSMTFFDPPEDAASLLTDTADLDCELSTDLESVVRAVPGVDTLYPTEPAVATIFGAFVDALKQRKSTSNLVSVATGEAGINVSVALHVADSQPAPEVCRLVFDSIAMALAARSITPIDTIQVTVASIG